MTMIRIKNNDQERESIKVPPARMTLQNSHHATQHLHNYRSSCKMIDNQLFFTHNECTMINSSKTHFGILQYAAIIPIPGKELQISAEIVTFSLFDLTGVRFPKERIRKGLKEVFVFP